MREKKLLDEVTIFQQSFFLGIFKHEYINIPLTVQSLLFLMRDPHFCFVGAMFAQNPFCTKCKSKQRSVLHKIKKKIQFSNIYLSLSHCPMEPLLNGKIERKSDHLLDLPRAQLSDAINIVAVNRYFAILVLHCGINCGRLPFWYIV